MNLDVQNYENIFLIEIYFIYLSEFVQIYRHKALRGNQNPCLVLNVSEVEPK